MRDERLTNSCARRCIALDGKFCPGNRQMEATTEIPSINGAATSSSLVATALDDRIGPDCCTIVVEQILRAASSRSSFDKGIGPTSDVECDAADLAALSRSCKLMRALCRQPLAQCRHQLTASLAHRLAPLAVNASGATAVHNALGNLSKAEGRLLSSLLAEPAPLLSLQTDEGRLASWLIMRLVCCFSAPLLDACAGVL